MPRGKSWKREDLDKTVPPVIHTFACTLFTRKVQGIQTRWSMPDDEFKLLKRALMPKEGIIWAHERPSYIVQLGDSIVLCM